MLFHSSYSIISALILLPVLSVCAQERMCYRSDFGHSVLLTKNNEISDQEQRKLIEQLVDSEENDVQFLDEFSNPSLTIASQKATALPDFSVISATCTINVFILDPVGSSVGFRDLSPPKPNAPGNSGTTLGEQRVNALRKSMTAWAGILHSSQPINVEVQFRSDYPCFLLASSGSRSFHQSATFPFPQAWYAQALANSLGGVDRNPDRADLRMQFNSMIDQPGSCPGGPTWYYGLSGKPPEGDFDFSQTLFHEFTHGLGFETYVNLETGELRASTGTGTLRTDVFMEFLFDESQNRAWNQMTNTQRAHSAINTDQLTWNGPRANARGRAFLQSGLHPQSNRLLMFAPSAVVQSSSVAHFSPTVFPNELMEPFPSEETRFAITLGLLQDIGWQVSYPNESALFLIH